MDISALELYKTIASKSNEETATKVMEALKGTIQEEIKHPIHELKAEMKDEFNKVRLEAKQLQVQTLIWIVGIGVLQLVAYYFLK